jgi:hypothetical protein
MISAPRVDVSSPSDASQADAGQLQEADYKTWLVRKYDWCIEKFADDAEFVSIALFAAAPVALATGTALTTGHPFWMLTIPLSGFWCYCTAMISVISYREKIAERDERIKEINDSALWRLCESRREQCDALMAECTQLEHDKVHLLCERGLLLKRLKAAEREAAAGQSRSENQEVSAAVVEFPNPKGAA